jgi:nucleotide-binding universal stress UspA family protein
MLERLLVPLDGSPIAESILPQVGVLARGLGQPVVLLMVLPRVEELRPEQGGFDAELSLIQERRQQYAEQYLDSVRLRLESEGVRATTAIESGMVAPAIIDAAEKQRSGGILMATHGRGGARRWVLGSVADKVVRTSPVPVLLNRPREETSPAWEAIRTILLPLDGSALSVGAIPYAAFLAERFNAKVIVIRTVGMEWVAGPGPEVGQYASADLLGFVEGDIRDYLEARVRDLKARGIESESHFVPFSDPDTAISTLAERTPDSLVTMTTHGRSGFRRALLGSVTDRVIRRAPVPVLVIPAAPEE